MNEDLPSINDFIEDRSNLPSIKDFIEESRTELSERVETELPSYKDFLEKKEHTPQVIQEEVKKQPAVSGADLSSVITLIEGVRNSIPEVKSYDKELYELMHLIEELRRDIPEVKSYDQEIKEIKESIPTVPEVRYYDREIQELRDSIPTVPEVKYYDQDIKELKESISEVKDRYIPDFRWIYKSFNQLDESQENLTISLSQMKNRLDMEMNNFLESMDVVKFETSVDTKSLGEKVEGVDERLTSTEKTLVETIDETKSKIYKELRDASLRIWNLKKEFQEDDNKLKKELGEQYKKLSGSIDNILTSQEDENSKFNSYLEGLKEEINNLPEVKYYDKQISEVNESVENVRSLVEVLETKLNNKIEGLKESILSAPPSENNSDPLTPLDQNFATLDDLSNHYRLFINRIQTQLASLGGGGEVRLEFLDDVDRATAKVDGKFLQYQSSTGRWVGASPGGVSLVGTEGQFLQHNGTEYVGVGSTAVTETIRDASQGFYGYTTDFYTVGVANTTQELGEDEYTLVQPQVSVGGTYSYLPTRMHTCNDGNPWIGAGATIGTGQTEFSLAGTIPRSTVLVRFAYDFIPDVDDSDLDLRLHFTTNTATQGTGLTNFNIDKQGLVCSVGASITYGGENLISFFVGDTLYGDDKDEAGRFCVQVNASDGGTLEVKALNVIVDV